GYRDIHHGCHLTYGNKLGNLKYLVAFFQLRLLGPLTVRISLISTVLGSFSFSGFPLKFFKSLTHLFLYILLVGLLLGHRPWAFPTNFSCCSGRCGSSWRSGSSLHVLADPAALFLALFFLSIGGSLFIVFFLGLI